MTQNDNDTSGTVRLKSVSAVTWTDDDGTTYKRVFSDGEIKDIEVAA